ncbi:hypothetical protein [Metabacillus iocasae]|uniref:MARVEL domain-containing protein n=1 Tax=Priestia iocasae TaxID=2291674 RepID=A0ABS2R034_9BACI|nr:hypothetical protein [Metabacillus iocasae]MBM7704341.1 hypothetical protein [Metabacillus iocasae]
MGCLGSIFRFFVFFVCAMIVSMGAVITGLTFFDALSSRGDWFDFFFAFTVWFVGSYITGWFIEARNYDVGGGSEIGEEYFIMLVLFILTVCVYHGTNWLVRLPFRRKSKSRD